MLLDPDLGYYDEGLDLTDGGIYASARREFGEATTLPPASYRSKVFSSLEDNRIWARNWIAVGLDQQIPTPGDLLPFTIGYHGIHVQRLADGGVIGRFNKAQHGGCRAVPLQCQTGARTRCSFTSCGYSQDRDVIKAEDLGSDQSAAQQYLGLVPERAMPVRIESWGPILFACLDPDTPALADTIGGIEQSVPSSLASRLIGTDWLAVPANWKLIGPALRDLLAPQTDGQWQSADGAIALESWPVNQLATKLPQENGAPDGQMEFAWLFPNLLVLRLPNISVVVVLQPLSMTATQLRIFLLTDDNSQLDAGAVAILRQGWRAIFTQAGERASTAQERLNAWGTPKQPDTVGSAPPLQDNQLSWMFQTYLIDSILDGKH